jgi:hypothetical protein
MLPVEPDRVTVTIDNPTDHRLYINASTPDDTSLSFVTIVGPRAIKSMPDVIDRGPIWVLHLRTLGAAAGTIEVSRADLVNGSAVIPLTINDDLAAAGVPVDVDDPETVPTDLAARSSPTSHLSRGNRFNELDQCLRTSTSGTRTTLRVATR